VVIEGGHIRKHIRHGASERVLKIQDLALLDHQVSDDVGTVHVSTERTSPRRHAQPAYNLARRLLLLPFTS
jgi:hypothetical protein